VKLAKSSAINFDPTLRDRNEVQKNKPTPCSLTEFREESEKNNRFSPRELLFLGQNGFLKKLPLTEHLFSLIKRFQVKK
jgi:hypothetical protein